MGPGRGGDAWGRGRGGARRAGRAVLAVGEYDNKRPMRSSLVDMSLRAMPGAELKTLLPGARSVLNRFEYVECFSRSPIQA